MCVSHHVSCHMKHHKVTCFRAYYIAMVWSFSIVVNHAVEMRSFHSFSYTLVHVRIHSFIYSGALRHESGFELQDMTSVKQ